MQIAEMYSILSIFQVKPHDLEEDTERPCIHKVPPDNSDDF